jgi:uncharacterized protein involved in type VI secretion and phage assembly
MSSLFDWVSELTAPSDERLQGVMVGSVVDNLDLTGLGRVQLSLPRLPEQQPWARVAAPAAGDDYGLYAIPQVGDEVLVAFEGGDLRHPYVVGCLWSSNARPPGGEPMDPVSKRILRTPKGHVVELDDTRQSVKVTTSTEQVIELEPNGITLDAGQGAATIELKTDGSITIRASQELKLEGSTVSVRATSELSLNGSASASLQSSGSCSVQGTPVRIN